MSTAQTMQGYGPCHPLPITLFLGGTRSGKSALAEEYAMWCVAKNTYHDSQVLYVATAEACDTSIQNRIERHKARRPKLWQTAEIPCNLAAHLEALLQTEQSQPQIILLDCVTLWVSNILFAQEKTLANNEHARLDANAFENACLSEIMTFFDLVEQHQDIEWILVSGETGLGGIGASHLERLFQDGLGLVNQRLAQRTKQRFLCVAGCTLSLPIERPWH